MNTAPPVAAPASVTVGGLTLTSAMTPEQRFEAIKSANVQPAQFHTDHTVAGMTTDQRSNAERVAAGKAPPPTPAALEAANKPANVAPHDPAKVAAFDAEMRAAGKQITPSAGTPAPGEIDQEGIDLVTARYKVLATAAIGDEAMQLRQKQAWLKDLANFYDGKQLTDAQRTEMRRTGDSGSFISEPRKSKQAPPAATPVSQHPPQAWAEAHVDVASKDGMIPLERINKNGLSGYVLPKLVDGQTYHVSVFQELAAARAAGLSQKQVDSFIRTDMVNNGWIKA